MIIIGSISFLCNIGVRRLYGLSAIGMIASVEEFAEPQFSGLSQLRDVAEG